MIQSLGADSVVIVNVVAPIFCLQGTTTLSITILSVTTNNILIKFGHSV
jgi:hypothetical protein